MLIHEQLRQAREEAGLTQAALSALTGLSRNQIVRAEMGENITIDTLRRIIAHLPIEKLNITETVKLEVDYLDPAEQMFFFAGQSVFLQIEATRFALELAATAFVTRERARERDAAQRGEQAVPDLETDQLLTRLSHLALEMEMHRQRLFYRREPKKPSGG